MKYTLEINDVAAASTKFYAHIEAVSKEAAIEAAHMLDHNLQMDGVVLQATNYNDPNDSTWGQDVIDARAGRFDGDEPTPPTLTKAHGDNELIEETVMAGFQGYDADFDLYPDFNNEGDFHIRCGSWERVFFDAPLIDALSVKFAELNARSKEFEYTFTNTSNFEFDDERTWAARIYFTVKAKQA